MGLSVTFGEDSVGYWLEGTEPAEWLNVMYNTFARSAWGFALSWLIFACFHGYGGNEIVVCYGKIKIKDVFLWLLSGFINTFLSWEAFGPLGKMAFTVYLIHYPLLRLIIAQYTYPVVVSNLLIVSKF